jgi:hypothetical protein
MGSNNIKENYRNEESNKIKKKYMKRFYIVKKRKIKLIFDHKIF